MFRKCSVVCVVFAMNVSSFKIAIHSYFHFSAFVVIHCFCYYVGLFSFQVASFPIRNVSNCINANHFEIS